VPTQALFEIHVKSSQPFLLRDVFPGTEWTPYHLPVRTRARNVESMVEGEARDGNCLKGALIGLCLEAAMGLCMYGIWHAWQMIR
jgi:hypothetical protein